MPIIMWDSHAEKLCIHHVKFLLLSRSILLESSDLNHNAMHAQSNDYTSQNLHSNNISDPSKLTPILFFFGTKLTPILQIQH